MKTFSSDLAKFGSMLERKEPFALSRFGDGELAILTGQRIGNKEFQYPGGERTFSRKLWQSFLYDGMDYYTGIVCPCCMNEFDFEYMRTKSGRDEEHLTWNNIWVNANHAAFLSDIVPLFAERTVMMVSSEAGNVSALPFPVFAHVPTLPNAWMGADQYVKTCLETVERDGPDLVLVAAGPLSEVLIHEMHRADPERTYLDVGSALDQFLFGRGTRGYSKGAPTREKVCVWGEAREVVA